MRLLSLSLTGRYKGLEDQIFEFNETTGNILAFVGLNGSGKSQVLELVTETFAYIERWKREDFKTRSSLGFEVTVIYQYDISKARGVLDYHDALFEQDDFVNLKVSICSRGTVNLAVWGGESWFELEGEKHFPTPIVIGYSSGLNENLQRGFMKNAVQYYDVMRTRLNRRKELSVELTDFQMAEINKRYLKRNPHIFKATTGVAFEEDGYLSLQESDTPVSDMIYLDYDSAGLLMVSLAMLPEADIDRFLSEVTFKYPKKIVLQYDLRGGVAEEDAIRDIQMLLRVAGEDNVDGIGKKTTDKQYDVYELDYLAGVVTLNLNNKIVVSKLRETNYKEPIRLFLRLYKLQQLGVKNWQGVARRELRKDNFVGTVKKPLKTKQPLSVVHIELSDGNSRLVGFDDLSDGEAQLLQTLAAVRIFSSQPSLFLFDEPETHLNPSWRTYFHKHLSTSFTESLTEQNSQQSSNSQLFLSTHSPFLISSLKKENVFYFQRDDDNMIGMEPVASQTYGASFEVLIKEHFKMKSLISQTVVEDIKDHLPKGEGKEERLTALEWIDKNVGESMEKAYLIRKLKTNAVSS